MKIYSYVITSDNGFAPNPFYGYCTLATCKPAIRRKAERDDWIIGTGSVENVGNDRLIYAMKVTDKMSLEDYAEDKKFAKKIPAEETKRRLGDNLYYRGKDGKTKQRFSSQHNHSHIARDLRGKNVLISESGNFYYFGKEAPALPHDLLCLIKKGPNHKCNFPDDIVEEFLKWIKKKKPGIYGKPCDYSESSSCNVRRKHIAKPRK